MCYSSSEWNFRAYFAIYFVLGQKTRKWVRAMEVNKPEATASLNRDGRKSPGYKSPHGQDHEGGEDQDQHKEHVEQWTDNDSFEVGGGVIGPISLEVQDILDALAAQIEPLRQELERTRARESQLHNRAQRHSYLPVFSRFGLENEFSRITGHLQSLGSVTFICVSSLSAEKIRREFGRRVYEQAMSHLCDAIGRVIREEDSLGCLGGHDLGVLILASSDNTVSEFSEKLRQELSSQLFDCRGAPLALDVSVHGAFLSNNSTLADILEVVDKQ